MSTRISDTGSALPGHERRSDLDRRLATLFWALLFILMAAIWLMPAARVPAGTWLVGIGVILLSLNAVRLLNGIPIRVLPTLLGALALAGGLAEYAGVKMPLVPLMLLVIGASIILEPVAARKS